MCDWSDSKPLEYFNWEEFERGMDPQNISQTGYDEEPIFEQGIAIVQRNGKYGAIMLGGKEIVPPIYEALSEFKDGVTIAEYQGEKRTINLSGQVQVQKGEEQIFLPELYDWGYDFIENVCVVIKKGKYGLISNDFQELLETAFTSIVNIGKNAYFAKSNYREIIINIESNKRYYVSECLYNENREILSFIVSSPENRELFGVIDCNLNLLIPIEYDQIEIKENQFFIVHHRRNGYGLFTLYEEVIPIGKYSDIKVLNENFIVVYNRDKSSLRIQETLLLTSKGVCIYRFSKNISFSLTEDGYVRFNWFKISSDGILYFIQYKTYSNRQEEIGQYRVAKDFVRYEYLELFNNNQFVVGQKDENGVLRFGVVDSKGLIILPFEYNRLKILSKDFMAYSTDSENILDLKDDYKDKDLRWLLYRTDYGKFGDKLKALNFGIINSDYKIICTPKYRDIRVIQIESSFFFLVNIGGWGIIDITGKVILPIKFDHIDFIDKKHIYDPVLEYDVIKMEHLSGIVSNGPSWDSNRKQNEFDENGMFVIPLTDGRKVQIPSTTYDWCDNFNVVGWAKVIRNGLFGKINTKGELISMIGEKMMIVPNVFDWAYDFIFGYAPVYKGGKWGIADKKWTIVIPCVYESIEPICAGYFKYIETYDSFLSTDDNCSRGVQIIRSKRLCGIVNIDNVEIAKAEYKEIWPLEAGLFLFERAVENTADRFGIMNNSGNLVIPPNYSETILVRMEGKDFWIVTQNGKKGVLYLGKNLILNIFDDITTKDGVFVCKANSESKDNEIFVKYNINGEILISHNDYDYIVSAEYATAYYAGYGLIRVVKDGKWGLINTMNDVIVTPRFSFIDIFNGAFAKVGVSENNEKTFFPNKGWYNNMKYGLIDTLGEIALPIEYNYITKWDNGYYLAKKDNLFTLLSPSLRLVIKTDKRLEKLDDRYIIIKEESNYGDRCGLIDFNGNEIISTDEEQRFEHIEVMGNGFLKVFHVKRPSGESYITILNNQGKTIYESHDCDDIKFLDNGFLLEECKNYGFPTKYCLKTLQGKNILPPASYYDIKFFNDGMLSIKRSDGWGLADIRGNIIIDTMYLYELVFKNDIANIQVKGSSLTQKINKEGKVIVHNGEDCVELPDYVYWGTNFTNQISIVRGRQGIGAVNVKGETVIYPKYKRICLLSNKTFRVQDEDCYGIFSLKGEPIFPPIFTSIEYLAEDRIRVEWNSKVAKYWNKDGYVPGETSDKHKGYGSDYYIYNRSALCNSKGEIVNDEKFVHIGKFVNQYACVCKEIVKENEKVRYKQIGIIDITGKTIIPPVYDNIRLSKGSLYAKIWKDGKFGILHIKTQSKYIYDDLKVTYLKDFDKLGRCVFSEDSDYGRDCDGYIQGTCGVASIKGIVVPSGKYRGINLLDNGLIEIYDYDGDYVYGLLNKQGKEILPMEYSYISSFKGGYATVCLGGKWSYDFGARIEGGKWGVIDETGKFVKECISDEEEKLSISEESNIKNNNDKLYEAPSVILSDKIPEDKEGRFHNYRYSSHNDNYDSGASWEELGKAELDDVISNGGDWILDN